MLLSDLHFSNFGLASHRRLVLFSWGRRDCCLGGGSGGGDEEFLGLHFWGDVCGWCCYYGLGRGGGFSEGWLEEDVG